MAKRIHGNLSADLTYIPSVRNLNALGNRNHYGRLFRCQIFYIRNKLINVKYLLRQVNRITAFAVIALCKSCRRRKPSCVTSHNLYDADSRLLRAK